MGAKGHECRSKPCSLRIGFYRQVCNELGREGAREDRAANEAEDATNLDKLGITSLVCRVNDTT
jgi:hypothetical protein